MQINIKHLPIKMQNFLLWHIPAQLYFAYYCRSFLYKYLRAISLDFYQIEFEVPKSKINLFFYFYKMHFLFQFKQIVELACVDTLSVSKRFTLYYELLSVFFSTRIRCKVSLENTNTINTLTSIYPNLN